MNYIKMSPLAGMVGYGGGGTGLTLHSSAGMPWYGGRGFCINGHDGNYMNDIEYITISTTGNASDFGGTADGLYNMGAASGGGPNAPRAMLFGGFDTNAKEDIQYLTVANTGNASGFGDLTVARGCTACSSGTRGIAMGGMNSSSDVMDYITIDTADDATDFGNLSSSQHYGCGTNDQTRGIYLCGGTPPNYTNLIQYITMDTTGNASTFGYQSDYGCYAPSSCSDETRALICGGYGQNGYDNRIHYITVQTTGNSSDFGDSTQGRNHCGNNISDGSRGITGMGGYAGHAGRYNIMDYVTISSTGNASDFGDLGSSRANTASTAGGS